LEARALSNLVIWASGKKERLTHCFGFFATRWSGRSLRSLVFRDFYLLIIHA